MFVDTSLLYMYISIKSHRWIKVKISYMPLILFHSWQSHMAGDLLVIMIQDIFSSIFFLKFFKDALSFFLKIFYHFCLG